MSHLLKDISLPASGFLDEQKKWSFDVIDKTGPTGARGASFGGSWTLLLNTFCTETASPTAGPQDQLTARKALGWAAELAKPAAAVQLSFTRSSGCAKNRPSHTHNLAPSIYRDVIRPFNTPRSLWNSDRRKWNQDRFRQRLTVF
jgi:hypothetical protein